MICVETLHLNHQFSENETVLNNINLQVEKGSIYGFLGPNGAGKTTTLKLLLGLLKKQQGEIRLFGKPFESHRVELLKQVGSLIETPSLYGHLTAVENLKLLQKIYQFQKSRIGEVLKKVGLSGTGNKKTSRFSLGMKQRMGIAIALVHNPSLLILDEPSNGLDPNGMIEIRELLKTLNLEHGITIIISSHLLSEIEKLVTHLGVIHKGNMLFQGKFEELRNRQKQSLHVIFETNDTEKTIRVLSEYELAPTVLNGKIQLPPVEKDLVADITRQLVRHGVEIYEISYVRNDLESIFMNLISH